MTEAEAIAFLEARGHSVLRARDPVETLRSDWTHVLCSLRMICDRVQEGTPLHITRYTNGDPRELMRQGVESMLDAIFANAVIDKVRVDAPVE